MAEQPTEDQNQQPIPQPQPVADPLAECQKLRDEYLAGWQRAKADYLNLASELAERVKEEFEAGQWSIIKEMISVLDAFRLATENIPDDIENHSWVVGIMNAKEDLERRLKWFNTEPIEVIGKPFDPAYHESLESVPSDQPEGTIVEELQKGYVYKGRVLRPARVKIAAKS